MERCLIKNDLESPERIVHCEDALTWLSHHSPLAGSSLLASLPDFSEFQGLTLEQWKNWITDTAALVLSRCPDEGVTVFYQSDIRLNGVWVDKAYLCQKAAEKLGHELIWHKVVARVPVGAASFGRPGYSHILCFSKSFRPDVAQSTPDIMPELGEKTWVRGMGFEACQMIAHFVHEQVQAKTLIHPFCGEGGMLAVANSLGLNAIGIERSPRRAARARRQQIHPVERKWLLDSFEQDNHIS